MTFLIQRLISFNPKINTGAQLHIQKKFVLDCLLVGIFFLTVPIIIYVRVHAQTAQSNCVVTKVGSPSASPSLPANCETGSPGICQEAPPVDFEDSEDYSQAIKAKWNITVSGLTPEQMQMIWEEFHEIDCVGLLQDIKGTIIQGWNAGYSQQIDCPGNDTVDVQFGQHFGEYAKALMTHELTHVWQQCTENGEANLLEIPPAFAEEEGLTKYSRGECPDFPPPNAHNEDHADTIALYLNPEEGELTCGNGAPNPFLDGAYPMHRQVAKNGVGNQQ